MKLKTLILLLAFSLVNGLNFFTATVDQPDAPYSQLLSGNDVFEQLYGTFNSTGLVLLGGAIVLSAGLFAIPFLPDPKGLEDELHKFRNGPLGFIPKPGFGKKEKLYYGDISTSAPSSYDVPSGVKTSAKPVVYSLSAEEPISNRNDDLNLGPLPGPPYTTLRPKKKHQVYVHVDHPYVGQKIQTTSNIPRDHQVTQVIEPVVNTITNAIKSTFKQRNEIERSDRVPTNFDYYNAANEIEDTAFPTYSYPLDYEYDDVLPKMPYSATTNQDNLYEKLYNLKNIYKKPPPTNKRKIPTMNTARSEKSYYVYPRRTKQRFY